MHQAGVEKRLHHDGDAADLVDVVHHEAPEGLEVADVRDLGADPVEVVEGQVDLGLAGDGEEVQDGVGRATEGHHDGDGVLEGLLGHDLPRPDAELEQPHHRLAGGVGEVVATTIRRRRR